MRLFVAIRFSPAVRRALLDGVLLLRGQGRGTFTQAENLHLTLAFLGETDRESAAGEALAAVCAQAAPFSMTVGGLGRFGDIWWAGVAENARLERLALEVQQALRARGFSIERRPWKPHVTLVRRWRGPQPAVRVPDTAMTVDRISLMASRRTAGRLVYTELHSWKLSKKPGRP